MCSLVPPRSRLKSSTWRRQKSIECLNCGVSHMLSQTIEKLVYISSLGGFRHTDRMYSPAYFWPFSLFSETFNTSIGIHSPSNPCLNP